MSLSYLSDFSRYLMRQVEYAVITTIVDELFKNSFDTLTPASARTIQKKIIKATEKKIKEEKTALFDELNSIYKRVPNKYKKLTKKFGNETEGAETDILINNLIMTESIIEEYFKTFLLPVYKAYMPWTVAIGRYLAQVASIQIWSDVSEIQKYLLQIADDMINSGLRIRTDDGETARITTLAMGEVHRDIVEYIGLSVEEDMKKLGTRYVEVSAHMTARPTHKVWQGKIYYWSLNGEPDPQGLYPDFITHTGYGESLGLLGINCYHIFRAFDPKRMKPTYSKKELERINTQVYKYKFHNKVLETDSEINAYRRQLEDRMDKLERRILVRQRNIPLTHSLNGLKMKFRHTRSEYIDFTRTFNTPTRTIYVSKNY